jgi:hypothetical protein
MTDQKTEKVIVTTSKRFSLNAEDFHKWLMNQKTFLAPLGMFYLAYVISEVGKDGISLMDFVPSNLVIATMVLYILNAAYDLFRKWAGEKTYLTPVEK